MDERCCNRYKSKPDFKTCSGCGLFQYCGKDCKLEDWQSFHKHGECRLFHKLSSFPEPLADFLTRMQYSSLFLRTHLLLKAKPQLMHQKFQMHDGTERSLADVPDDAAPCGRSTRFLTATCGLLQFVNRNYFAEEEKHAFKSLFHKVRSSAVLIKCVSVGLGFGLYVPITGLKHSCIPNAAHVFKGRKLEVRAMRDIVEGEDVTIDLIDVIVKPKAERQKALADFNGIVCDCDRCREGDQEDEVTELSAIEQHRELVKRGAAGGCHLHRSVFDGFMRLMEIKEKYHGRYHPDFVFFMYYAAFSAAVITDKTEKDKQDFDLLVERLKEAIPLSYGLDHEVVNMQELLRVIAETDWSNLLPWWKKLRKRLFP